MEETQSMLWQSSGGKLELPVVPTAGQQEEDFGWAMHWEDDSESVVSASLVDILPPQLHPTVSLGMKRVSSMHRVSSCAYFSLQGSVSEADLYSLASGDIRVDEQDAHADWLYHDIIMHVFTFLDAKSLAAFSETARRCNYESFYFLQLQLQRALLEDNLTSCLHRTAAPDSCNDRLAAIAGSWAIARLASLDKQEAKDVVQEYLDSNSTLRTMPLSHSLAYIRHVLRRNGFPGQTSTQPAQALTTSAVLIGLVGAAVMSGNVNVEVVESFGTELPNMLFKVGFVGSLMGAARHGWESQHKEQTEQAQPTMREAAEQMARTLQDMLNQVRMTATSFEEDPGRSLNNKGKSEEKDDTLDGPWSPNPYEHLPIKTREVDDDDNGEEKAEEKEPEDNTFMPNSMLGFNNPISRAMLSSPASTTSSPSSKGPTAKMPSGCVGAYFRAIQRASKSITLLVQIERRKRFEKLVNKEEVARTFIDACCSDDRMDVVKSLVQERAVIDASGFYVGSDGTETCALHASAFHGATNVLEFLCGGIDERDASRDEGLCSVDLQDQNGWTALHFAAGANCVESARILADRGANLSVVAENGYTPLQWAQRLCNHEVAEEIRTRMETGQNSSNSRWISGASQPLSMIAHRFFAMIPTN